MWSGCGRTVVRHKTKQIKDIHRPKCESFPGSSVKINNTYFFNDTIHNHNGSSHQTEKNKKRSRNDVCACGDTYCNRIMKFVGHVITEKIHYRRPSLCGTNTSQKKLTRNRKIHVQIKRWRSLQNLRFPGNQISVTPSNSARFNEIHYPVRFLKEQKRSKVCRIPMEMGVELAKKVNMFSDDFVYENKNTVLTIPTLNSWETIQVHYYISWILTKHD